MYSYQTFLSILRNSKYTIKKICEYDKSAEKVIYLRHDIDIDVNQAAKMAELENKYDIYSTYFMLHTAPYFVSSLNVYKKILSLKHEVGLHNNERVFQYCLNYTPKKYMGFDLRNSKKFLEEQLGVSIVSTSSHGDFLLKKIGGMNLDIFKQRGSSLEDYGFMYEASKENLKTDFYISDASNKVKYKEMEEMLDRDYKTILINIHPIWWKGNLI